MIRCWGSLLQIHRYRPPRPRRQDRYVSSATHPYVLFSQDLKNKGLSHMERGVKWNALSAEERAVYQQRADDNRSERQTLLTSLGGAHQLNKSINVPLGAAHDMKENVSNVRDEVASLPMSNEAPQETTPPPQNTEERHARGVEEASQAPGRGEYEEVSVTEEAVSRNPRNEGQHVRTSADLLPTLNCENTDAVNEGNASSRSGVRKKRNRTVALQGWHKFRSNNLDTVYEEVVASGVERGSAEASQATTSRLLDLWKESRPALKAGKGARSEWFRFRYENYNTVYEEVVSSGVERGSSEAMSETQSHLKGMWAERRGPPRKSLKGWHKFRSDNLDTVYEEVVASGVERGSAEAFQATTSRLLDLWKDSRPAPKVGKGVLGEFNRFKFENYSTIYEEVVSSGVERGSSEAESETKWRVSRMWAERKGPPRTWNSFRSRTCDAVYEEIVASGVERGSAEASQATTSRLLDLWKESRPASKAWNGGRGEFGRFRYENYSTVYEEVVSSGVERGSSEAMSETQSRLKRMWAE
eukprot:Hpha_TRINITY_DN15953_c0_g1::TRINITY_DN15953_c0_g1_i8::g.74538::m.74538